MTTTMIRGVRALVLFAPAALLACSTAGAPPPGDPPLQATASPSVGAPSITGTWSSPSCGARAYERRIAFDPGGTFVAEDRVSPCPPGVACVWSGIALTRGAYTVSGDEVRTVLLSIDAGRPRQGQPFPTTLAIDGGALVEVWPEVRCAYARVAP